MNLNFLTNQENKENQYWDLETLTVENILEIKKIEKCKMQNAPVRALKASSFKTSASRHLLLDISGHYLCFEINAEKPDALKVLRVGVFKALPVV